MKRLGTGVAAIALCAGLIGVGATEASSATVLTPRGTSPKALGFGTSWGVHYRTTTCQPGGAATRCLAVTWMRPNKVARPPEFNQHLVYSASTYPTVRGARLAAARVVAVTRALAPPKDTALSNLVVKKTFAGDAVRHFVSFLYDGPQQRIRYYVVQRGRRVVQLSLGSNTPLGALPVVTKPTKLWNTLTYLAR